MLFVVFSVIAYHHITSDCTFAWLHFNTDIDRVAPII